MQAKNRAARAPAETGTTGRENVGIGTRDNRTTSAPRGSAQAPLTDEAILIAMLRCGRIRAQLAVVELDEIGVCLSHGAIDAAAAIAWVRDCELQGFLYLPPAIEGEAA